MARNVIMFFVWIALLTLSTANWSASLQTYGSADYGSAVASLDNNIYIIGGKDYTQQITEYQMDTDEFLNLGELAFPFPFYCVAQAWTQQEDIVYVLRSSYIQSYNLNTNAHHYRLSTTEVTVGQTACLASSEDHLYVVGGNTGDPVTYLDTVQVFDLSTNQWISDVPSMNEARGNAACIVHSDNLLVFGGMVDGTVLSANERIDTINIAHNTWQVIPNLITAVYYSRAVFVDDLIYIIGGRGVNRGVVDTVQIFDTTSEMFYTSSDTLSYPVESAATIAVDNAIYVFGGKTTDGVATDQWMYQIIPTPKPTAGPTIDPTPPPTDPTIDLTPPPTDSTIDLTPPPTDPTIDPTIDLTPSPTDPVLITLDESAAPTLFIETDNGQSSNADDNDSADNQTANEVTVISSSNTILFIIMIVLICILIGLCCFQRKRMQEAKSMVENMQMHGVEQPPEGDDATTAPDTKVIVNGDNGDEAKVGDVVDKMSAADVLQQVLALSLIEEEERKKRDEIMDEFKETVETVELEMAGDSEREVMDTGKATSGAEEIADDYKQEVDDAMDDASSVFDTGALPEDTDSDDDILKGSYAVDDHDSDDDVLDTGTGIATMGAPKRSDRVAGNDGIEDYALDTGDLPDDTDSDDDVLTDGNMTMGAVPQPVHRDIEESDQGDEDVLVGLETLK